MFTCEHQEKEKERAFNIVSICDTNKIPQINIFPDGDLQKMWNTFNHHCFFFSMHLVNFYNKLLSMFNVSVEQGCHKHSKTFFRRFFPDFQDNFTNFSMTLLLRLRVTQKGFQLPFYFLLYFSSVLLERLALRFYSYFFRLLLKTRVTSIMPFSLDTLKKSLTNMSLVIIQDAYGQCLLVYSQ